MTTEYEYVDIDPKKVAHRAASAKWYNRVVEGALAGNPLDIVQVERRREFRRNNYRRNHYKGPLPDPPIIIQPIPTPELLAAIAQRP